MTRKELFTVYEHPDGSIEIETPWGRSEKVNYEAFKKAVQAIKEYLEFEEGHP